MDEIGMAWIMDKENGIFWHNGGTENYNSYLGVQPETGTAALSNLPPSYRIPATVLGIKAVRESGAKFSNQVNKSELGGQVMTGIILYQSKYGATKKYAEWIFEETGFEYIETKKADIKKVVNFDTIVLGGGIYASGIAGLAFLKKNIGKLSGKKIVVYCSGASPYEESAFQQIRAHNMKDALTDIPVFYCRGAWDMESMSLKDRTLCSMLRNAIAKKDPADYEIWEKALMSAAESKCDWTDKKYIVPIIEYIKG